MQAMVTSMVGLWTLRTPDMEIVESCDIGVGTQICNTLGYVP